MSNEYWPKNDKNTLYIGAEDAEYGIEELLEICSLYFHETPFSDLYISVEYINTYDVWCDRYDPGDYTKFIVIKKKKK